jgi:hypothetical protein
VVHERRFAGRLDLDMPFSTQTVICSGLALHQVLPAISAARSSSAFFTLSPGDTPQFQFTDARLIGVAGIQRVK